VYGYINKCKIKKWKERSKKRADWEIHKYVRVQYRPNKKTGKETSDGGV